MKRICIITTSALGSNPRVVKEADTLSAAGYGVEVVSTRTLDRVDRYDEEIVAQAAWGSDRVDLRSPLRRKMLHARLFLTRALALVSGRRHFSIFGLALARLVLAKKADLYIAHYVGALPLAALAARRHGGRVAFDAEDFHLGDLPDRPEHEAEKQHIRAVEGRWLGSAAYVTAASSGIADAYQTAYGIGRPQVILNCFPRSRAPAAPSPHGTAAPGPSLYWVSQTIGPGRGLENAVAAIARTASRPHLYLRGTATGGYREQLSDLAQAEGAGDRLHFLAPAPPRDMEWLASAYDAGLVAETGGTANHAIALSNKQFIYLLAGIPALMSDTPAHKSFAQTAPGATFLFKTDDPLDLARALDDLLLNPQALAAARAQAFALGQSRYNWEIEQAKLLAAVAAAIGPAT